MPRLLPLLLFATNVFAADQIIAIKAARLIDGTGAAPITNAVVVVKGNMITAAGSGIAVPAGAKVIDLGDATILPGIVDAHTHGYVPGPRIETAGHAIGITGGHCDSNGYKPGLLDGGVKDGTANGAEEVRAAVRYQVKYGADVIKICATGGVLSEGDAVGATQYTYEEMKALVDEARKLDRKVAAHAHGTEGIKIAVRAGVSSIEHGSFIDEEGAKMTDRGTYLVPTLSAGERVEQAAKTGVLKGLRAEKALAAAAAIRKAVKLAVVSGVPIAMGTDAGVGPHGANLHELPLMVEWGGMRPLDAITAATMGGARLLGWEKKIGSLTAGKLADIIAVPGDPLQDIRRMERVSFVMKDGVVYEQ